MWLDPDFVSGLRDSLPLAVSVVPFGTILAATAVGTGFSPLQAVLLGTLVFAGPAQAAVIDLVGRTASIAVIVLTGLVINLRYLMYSGSLAPHFRDLSVPRRSVLASVLIDQVYALSITEFERGDDTDELWYYAGAGFTMWLAWVGSHVVGAVLGARVPDSLQLEFVLPLVFVTLLFTAVEDPPTKAAAAVAAVVAVSGAGLPFNSGLIVAAVVGVVAGLIAERGVA